MTKLVMLRVTVPVDDLVQTADVQKLLRTMIRGAGTVEIPSGTPGQPAPATLPLTEENGRSVFFLGADVKQGTGTVIRTSKGGV